MWGLGLSATPEGPATLPPWSSYLAIIWAPEKYRWPWLTELFFRFEPAPLFDSDPAGGGRKESAFRKSRGSSVLGEVAGPAVPARPARPAVVPVAVPAVPNPVSAQLLAPGA